MPSCGNSIHSARATPTAYTPTTTQRICNTRPMRGSYKPRKKLPSPRAWPCFMIQVDSTGTSVLDNKYEESIAKPTARDNGTNNCRPTPVIRKAGANTAKTHSIDRNRAIAVLLAAFTTERALFIPDAICVWMFSISTVASSTSTPTARASPPMVMMLMVCPTAHSHSTAESNETGIVNTTISALRQSRRNSSTINPVRAAPSRPSLINPRNALSTYFDWSNTNSTFTSSGHTACILGRFSRTRRSTSSVDASERFVTGM